MTIINYAASGNQRKKLVNALVEILECESEYLKAPSYAYRIGKFTVNRDGDVECPDEVAEEEMEAIIKKLTWHGFERILNESTEEIDGTPTLEEPALEAKDPTEKIVTDVAETVVEDSEEVLGDATASETQDNATEDLDILEETSEDHVEEPEAPTLPEGNFESNEESEEIADEEFEPIEDSIEQSASNKVFEMVEKSEEATDSSTKEATNEQPKETSDTPESRKIVIELPGSYLDEAELGRVRAIVASKASVLKKALETNDLSIERKEGKIRFPWFTNHGIDGEAKAYMQLVSGIAKRAKMLTRVTATESVSDNEKFTMRLFLVSLNFKGEEYKFARKFLLRNLSGNSSWRTEDAKARHDARKVQQEIEAPEVTIEHLSEGGEDDAELSE